MTYLHKLASRIARLWPFTVPVLLLAAACVKGDKADFLSPNPNPNNTAPAVHIIRVEPQIASIHAGTETIFTATGYSISGQVVPVTVDWVATGGSIWPDGRFVGDVTGNFSVTAKVRNQASISDSARVTVWENPNEIVGILVFPDSAVVQEGDTLQANAVLQLANGNLAPNATVQWTASSSASIDDSGRFTAAQTGSYVLSAQALNGIKASAPVFVRKRTLALTSLQVTPSTASVASGQVVPFAALATWSDGTSDPADVVWSATGGTITSAGVYTAGSSAGPYAVVAKQRRGSMADTAFISIQPPVIASVALSPKTVTVQPGATQQFTAQARLSDGSVQPASVTWQATSGSIDASGLFTAGSLAGGFKVIVHAVGSTLADTALVTVSQPSATISQLLLNPSAASVPKGTGRQFGVTATWSDGTSSVPVVSWAATGGTVSSSGLYSATSTPGTYRVIATSSAGTADTSVVTVTAPVLTRVALTPGAAALLPSQTIQFNVTGTYSDGSTATPVVSWSASGGSISAAGLYTAGATPGTYAMIATAQGTSLADTSLVTIGVAAPTLSSLQLSPASVALLPGARQNFTVTGTYSDGSTGTPAVSYAVTGGSMSGNQYTAGSKSGTYRVIATEVGGTHRDTSSVLITSLVTLTSLVLAPKPVVLSTGGTMQLSVSATWSDGSTTVPALTWTATGGTVSAAGLYSAGMTSGTYRVVATQQGATKADTAVVTLSTLSAPLPPPPGGLYANQPSGMTWSNERGFDAKVENGWGDRGDAAFSIVSDATAPSSPSNVGQALFDPMISCGTGPINTWSSSFTGGSRTFYLSFWLKMDPVWYANTSAVNKVLFIHIANGGRVVVNVNGIGTGRLAMEVRLQNMGVGPISWNASANLNAAAAVIPRGQWVHEEVLLVANTPGIADGQIHFWLNGVKAGQYANAGFSSAAETGALNVWQSIKWNPTYGGGCNGTSTNGVPDAPQFPVPQWMRIDHIYVSGK